MLAEGSASKVDYPVLRAFYDAEILYVDCRIRELCDYLRWRGVLNNTLLIVTSDHGDNIGEHGLMGHMFCLYDTLVRVPLLIKFPKSMAKVGRVKEVVQNTDVLPTLIDILECEDKDLLEQVEGNSLISPRIRKRRGDYAISELLKSFGPRASRFRKEFAHYDRRLLSVRTQIDKYIWSSNGKHEYYDLRNDPEETKNLLNQKLERVTELRAVLEPWFGRFNDAYEVLKDKIEGREIPQVDEDVKRRLQGLGYM
jgi:arylsulfatase A-like enzyme